MTLTARTTKAAVIGLGVGEQHARALQAIEGCEVTRLIDIEIQQAERLAHLFPNAKLSTNPDDALTDPDIDLVSIASPDDAHFNQVMTGLAHKKALFVEKPLCRSLDELDKVKNAWEAAGCPALDSNLVLRAAPLYRWLVQAVRAGELGQIYAIDAEYLYGRIHKITDGWRKDVEKYSVIQGGGVHMIDLMLAIAGQRPDSVHALGNRICTQSSNFRYNDFVAANYAFPSGLIGRVTANYGCVHEHHHVLRVYGTKATFLFDDAGARLHTSRDPEAAARKLDLDPLPSGKGVLIEDFVNAIVTGSSTTQKAELNFDLISTCIAADRSCEDGKSISVSYG
jgi:predicted dehydrogenase